MYFSYKGFLFKEVSFELLTLIFDIWPWKSIEFQILLKTKYVPSLVKIHWRLLILECSQRCYAGNIWPGDLTKLRRDIVMLPSVLPSIRPSHPCEHSRINILQWILTKLGNFLKTFFMYHAYRIQTKNGKLLI
jgi:hypothetical protein